MPIQTHDLFSADELKSAGIQLAIEHAELKHEGWADEALNHLKNFTKTRITPFLCEEVRLYAESQGLAPAPSARAWGGVIMNAKREAIIRHVGYRTTSNPRAHKTPASLWQGNVNA